MVSIAAGPVILALWIVTAAFPPGPAEARVWAAFQHPCPIRHVSDRALHHDCRKALHVRLRANSFASRDETDGDDGPRAAPPSTCERPDTGHWPAEWARGHVVPTGLMLVGTVRLLN